MKQLAIIGALLIVIAAGAAWYFTQSSRVAVNNTPTPTVPDANTGDFDEIADPDEAELPSESVLGKSAGGHEIMAYHFGEGEDEVLFIGGIHGGYSWNTSLVAYELVDYLEDNKSQIPENLRVTVIPVLNPDGLQEVVGTTARFTAASAPTAEAERVPGRFNENGVDLNRNFDCKWDATGTWRNREVSGGSAPFSEPETEALRDYVNTHQPTAVVAWFSAAGGVYASSCTGVVSAETLALTNVYANAAGYDSFEKFDFYAITGDMLNWFAKNDVPAISVLLSDHESPEWSKNQRGVAAVLQHYSE